MTGKCGKRDSVCRHFNSHAHVERDEALECSLGRLLYFNSHAHVERDLDKIDILRTALISTHTLTWSVTYAAMRL